MYDNKDRYNLKEKLIKKNLMMAIINKKDDIGKSWEEIAIEANVDMDIFKNIFENKITYVEEVENLIKWVELDRINFIK